MDTLLAGIGWFIGLCGVAVLFNASDIVFAWREWLVIRAKRPSDKAGGGR